MDCPDELTPDPSCRTCMPQCEAQHNARWGKVKDMDTRLPLSKVIITTQEVTSAQQEMTSLDTKVTSSSKAVTSAVDGFFGFCSKVGNVSISLPEYLPITINLENSHMELLMEKICKENVYSVK